MEAPEEEGVEGKSEQNTCTCTAANLSQMAPFIVSVEVELECDVSGSGETLEPPEEDGVEGKLYL